MAQKKYVSLEKLTKYDELIKNKIATDDAAVLKSAKDYADSLAENYEAAGVAATEAGKVQTKLDEEVTRAKAREDEIAGLVATAQDEVDALELVVDTKAAQADLEALAGKVGEVPADQTVMGIIANIQENAYDDTELKGLITGLESNKADKTQVATDIAAAVKVETDARVLAVQGVQDAVDTLSGTHATDKKALEDAIALKADQTALDEVSETLAAVKEDVDYFFKDALGDADAQQVKDTLKELQEYIASDESGAAAMAGNIQANADAIDAVEGRLDVVEPKVTTVEGKVSTLEGQMTTVQGAVATKAEAQALTDAVAALEDADAGQVERIEALEAKFGEGEGNVESQIATAKQEAIDTAAGDATTKANKAFEDAKKYADEEDAKIETRVDALETASGTHALASDLTALAGRVTTAEGEIDTLQSEMDAVEALAAANKSAHEANAAAIALKASQADLEAAVARIAANEAGLASFVEVSEEEINALFA